MRSIVRAARETEVEIVAAHLERIRHLDILQRPAPVIVLQILGAILEPDPNIALGFFSNQERKIVAAQNILPRVRLIVVPLNAGEAADVRKHAGRFHRTREASIGQKVLEVIDHVCGGSPEELVTALLDYRGLTPQELKRIRTMLDEAKATRPPQSGDS